MEKRYSATLMLSHKKLETLALQNLHYRLFHFAPKILAFSTMKGWDLLSSFLTWANENHLTMNWAMHMHFLRWLHQQEKYRCLIDTNLVKDVLLASVKRWSFNGLDHITAKGMMVTSNVCKELAVGLWKSESPSEPNKIVSLTLAKASHPNENSYAISYQQGDWREAKWLLIPA